MYDGLRKKLVSALEYIHHSDYKKVSGIKRLNAMFKPCYVLILLSLTGCTSQLPNTSLPVVDTLRLDSFYKDNGSIISSRNGTLSNNLTSVLGSVCVPDKSGKCDQSTLTAVQCLSDTSKVEIVPGFSNTPKEEYLISKNTMIESNSGIINLNINKDELLDVKINVVATAQIDDSTPYKHGYTSRGEIKKCVSNQLGDLDGVNEVYWVQAANIITVTTELYKEVSSAAGVTMTGFGFSGKTYNKYGLTRTEVFLGLDLRKVSIKADANSGPAVDVKPTSLNQKIEGNIFNVTPDEIFKIDDI